MSFSALLVYCFEPYPEMRKYLQKVVKRLVALFGVWGGHRVRNSAQKLRQASNTVQEKDINQYLVIHLKNILINTAIIPKSNKKRKRSYIKIKLHFISLSEKYENCKDGAYYQPLSWLNIPDYVWSR